MPVLGLNILGDRSLPREKILLDVAALDAKYHVVMNNPGLADAVLATGADVIYRQWDDDHANQREDARQFVRNRHALAPPGCLLYLGNEPDRTTLAQLNRWTTDALDECEKLGRVGVILNWATGNPEGADWQQLRGCVEKAYAGKHLLGLHQYFGAPFDAFRTWHIGREQDVYRAFGDRTPEIVITELGYVHANADGSLDAYRGWRGDLSADQYADDLGKAVGHYVRYGIHACLFAVSTANDEKWGTFVPSEAVIARMASINKQMRAAAANPPAPPQNPPARPTAPDSGVPDGWYWHRPVRAPFVVTSPFGERVKPEDWDKPPEQQRKEIHTGTDYTAADWTAYAAREGRVTFAGWNAQGYGNRIEIDHGSGQTSAYNHLERIDVKVGDAVQAGQAIAVIGSTGRSTARHLDWETRRNGVPYAPAPYTRPHPADITTPAPVPLPPSDTVAVPRAALLAMRAQLDAWLSTN